MEKSQLYLISGDNSIEIKNKTNEIIQEVTQGEDNPFGVDFYAIQEDISPIDIFNKMIRSAKTPGFLGNKVVCLTGFNLFNEELSKNQTSSSSIIGNAINDLCFFIEKSDFNNLTLILSGEGIDSRKTLYKLCQKKGIVYLFKKLQLSDRNWEKEMGTYISDCATQKGLKLSYDIIDYLITCIGTDAGLVDGELEKIWCYANGNQIQLEDVKNICNGEGESATWSFTNALCERNTESAYTTLHTLLKNSKNADQAVVGIIIGAANAFLLLLKIIILMKNNHLNSRSIKSWLENLSPENKERFNEQGFSEVVKLHPFRAFKLAEQAENYTEKEIIQAIIYLRDCNLSSIYEGTDNRTILEEIILRITLKSN